MSINTNYGYNYKTYIGTENNPVKVDNKKTIKGSKDDDFFNLKGDDVKIKSGAGNDYIRIEGFNNVVDAGEGDDVIDLVVSGKTYYDSFRSHRDSCAGFDYVEYDVTGGKGDDIFKISPSDTPLEFVEANHYNHYDGISFAEINIKDFNKNEDKIDLTAFGIGYEDIKSLSKDDELYLTEYYYDNNSYSATKANFRIDLQGMKWSDLDESNFVNSSYNEIA